MPQVLADGRLLVVTALFNLFSDDILSKLDEPNSQPPVMLKWQVSELYSADDPTSGAMTGRLS